uniref:Ig-like domain-containing protein n=1 Tax=Treponema sp. TaxID=166 RepID=UPI003891017F
SFDDGLVGIDVRATDKTGKTTTKKIAIQKDTTPPVVEVILPGSDDIVNGDNLIAFIAKDNGRLAKAEYIGPSRGAAPIALELAPMITTHVGTAEQPIDDLMSFRFTDAIGNATEIRQWDFIIDNANDLPVSEIHVPEENAVLTRDFEFSGVIYDDDGVKKDDEGNVIGGPKIFYKFDNGRYTELDQIGTSFIIPKKLHDFTDNEHSITVYALDINGTKGPEYTRNFRISLEEPKGAVLTPPISETVKGTVKLTGNATDKNGIKAVYISVDNGNSYDEALGNYGHEMTQCNWSYEFDTRVIEDGTHVVFMKVVDWYGIEGLYSSLINIDNTTPDISLELPLDDSKTTGMVFFSGQTTDNIALTKLYITIRSLDGRSVSSSLAHTELTPDEIITQSLDISSLSDGFYNIELTGVDAADNITRVSRNIQLDKKMPKAKVDLLYPLNGEYVQGKFNIYGTATSEFNNIENLILIIDGKTVAETTLSESGYFKYTLDQTMIEEGRHDIRVEAHLADSTKIISNTQYLNYQAVGPWVTIDSFNYGDFAFERPYVIGNAGYSYDEDEVVRANAKGAPKELKEAVAAKSVEMVELSLDNGKTFEKVSSSGKWRYRIENEDIAEGYHFLLIRAKMKNGEVAVTRCIVQVDSTKPTIKLISPGAGGHYNQEMVFRGLAHDDIALKSLTLALRKGDKAAYEIPAFIQGLYFDWQFWGATLFNVGAGLTFFDDNVKLQVQWGQFTDSQRELFSSSPKRYGGDNILGMKLLANVYYMPFRYYFGPDWEWLSLNVAVGANFTRFNESGAGKAQILSAGLVQLEFPRVTFSKQKMFRTIAFYTEGQLWFIPTDVSSDQDIKSLVPQISFGLRVNVF